MALMDSLVGKTINSLSVSDDQGILAFDTDAGVIAYETWSDCCSTTWFADITGVDCLLGHSVTKAEDIHFERCPDDNYLRAEIVRSEPPQDDRCRDMRDEFHGERLTTVRGYIDIIYRNSSNGYYGGDAEEMTTAPSSNMTPIIADWSA